MHELMDRNSAGGIAPAEIQELDADAHAWAGVSTLRSRARAFVNARETAVTGRG